MSRTQSLLFDKNVVTKYILLDRSRRLLLTGEAAHQQCTTDDAKSLACANTCIANICGVN